MLTIDEILKAVEGSELRFTGERNSSLKLEVSAVSTDTRKIPENSLFIALKGERFDGHHYLGDAVSAGASALCVDANFAASADLDFSVPIIVVPDTLKAYQQIANFYRCKLKNITVIGVTGSCGKTSVKEILRTLLGGVYGTSAVYATEANNNNAIGVPLSLLSLNKEHRVAVIEMGSNHPGEIEVLARTAEPDIAIITNIARAHLEFFHDLTGVATEKSAILAAYGSKSQPEAVIPYSSPGKEILLSAAGRSVYTFGEEADADIQVVYAGGNERGSSFKLIFSDDLKNDISVSDMDVSWGLTGKHQAMNAAAALLAVILNNRKLFAGRYANVAEALTQCTLTGGRMKLSDISGVKWINDAYNANPDSMNSALQWLAEFANLPTSHIVLGDMLELGDDALKFHKQILERAVELLPDANIYPVGDIMQSAADALRVNAYENRDEVEVVLSGNVTVGDLVYIKASRGMALDKLIPETD